MEFKGNPALYRRIAIAVTLYVNGGAFIIFALIKYALYGDTWVLGWKPVLITLLFSVWFGRTMYRWMMRLDARYGRGSGWLLESVRVKLPELRPRQPR
ncbi:hypothetical protein GPROT2_00073 [Gammaproteobacteria bacterium]|nr:MAG: hypothetical protein HRU81_08135 [Gammaproteobacteria bacterium]CAG0937943.1 hypothetical protein GPROT2_00073 [Gammaproteobacteria bacterium]